jgi:hypothetical protein
VRTKASTAIICKAGVGWGAAEVHTRTRRAAVLYSVGAHAVHCLRRTVYKRRTVETLLADPEWTAWSDREIARTCIVSNNFISAQRNANRTVRPAVRCLRPCGDDARLT